MSKKLISLLIAVCMLLCLSACGTTETDSNPTNTSSESQTNTVKDNDENAFSEENSRVSSNIEETNENDTTQTQTQTNQSKHTGTINQTTHTHIYLSANCTSPKKCACGATVGEALGHIFLAATYTTPKTCSRCGLTEGNKLNYPEIYGMWRAITKNDEDYKSEKEHYGGNYINSITIDFYDGIIADWYGYTAVILSAPYVEIGTTTDDMITKPEPDDKKTTPIEYNGKSYYLLFDGKGGGGVGSYFEVKGDTVTVYPKEEGASGGDLYEKIVLKFNNSGNLVIKELVAGKMEYGLHNDLSPLYVGMELKKVE